jgi:hypothetical protein
MDMGEYPFMLAGLTTAQRDRALAKAITPDQSRGKMFRSTIALSGTIDHNRLELQLAACLLGSNL